MPNWREAMSDELTALMRHGTWDLVPPPAGCRPISCKWVFRVKRTTTDTIDRFKARLVDKGFHQRPGIDYKETFSPVKPASTLPKSSNRFLTQLSVSTVTNPSIYCRHYSPRIIANVHMQIFPFTADITLPEL
ncbi:hypothetical protein Peur_011552 [Populus x canadensis]